MIKSRIGHYLLAFLIAGFAGADYSMAGGQGKGKPNKAKGKDKGKDKSKDKGPKDRPPGWDKGKKKGWKDEYPPGWAKKSDKDKEKWRGQVKEAREKVRKMSKDKGLSDKERRHMEDSVEILTRKGEKPESAVKEIGKAIKQGKKAMEVLKEKGITVTLE